MAVYTRHCEPVHVTQHAPDVSYEIVTIDGVFSEAEVAAMSALVYGRKVMSQEERDGRLTASSSFCNGKVLNEHLATSLFDRLTPHFPMEYVDREGTRWALVGPSRHIFYAVMRAGQQLEIHTDTGSVYDEAKGRSKFIVLLFLGDPENGDFVGGDTQFYTDAFQETACVRPKRGRVLCFDIDRFHAARPIKSGAKAWIGIELVYSLTTAIGHPIQPN